MISAVILAAGQSARLGVPKQLLAYKGRPILRVTAENILAAQVFEVIVVIGHEAGRVSKSLEGLRVKIIENTLYKTGQASSVRSGLEAVSPDAEAVLFALGDQPLVRSETLAVLIERHMDSRGITAPFYNGRRGNPVLFKRDLLNSINLISGDTGARGIIDRHPYLLRKVPVNDSGVLFDVDTWEDYWLLVNRQGVNI
ncbi:MAG: nucleotidyltransferase family protein [Bacillota bacterium]